MMFWFVLSLVCAIRLQNVVWGDVKIIIADNIITELRTSPPPKKKSLHAFLMGNGYNNILLYNFAIFFIIKKNTMQTGMGVNPEPWTLERNFAKNAIFYLSPLVFSILLYLCLSPLLFYLFGVIAVSKHKYRVSEKHLRAENIK